MDIRKMVQGLFFLSMLLGLAVAVQQPAGGGSGADEIEAGLCELYCLVKSALTIVVFLMIVAAAIIYAGGQILGAETRARASVWATSMFIGALIGVLIYIIMPLVLGVMDPSIATAGGPSACACT
jgi:hypothetical protein